ncbi:hypothetical protein PV11_02930 [Exophiala sideris]|uniref:FAD dependent oxidoreductase domain-containing protein n=1 Tax=Exophiala sideris TaxID=1016849 RepID=A0A0D1WF03_9EURO|nr:hypothetical protein PV11_02930 [Exophiala sideris]
MAGSWPETGPLSSGGKADSTAIPDLVEREFNTDWAKRYGFPKKNGYSLSYWLRGVQKDPLFNHRTTAELPASADIVIIGSGMTGTLAAKHCLATWPDKRVIVLEAREFCSGATGRNAGHCKPDQWRGFREYERLFGTEQALKILQNEQQTWSDVVKYVRENDVDCDLWVGDTLDVPVTSQAADVAKDSFERYKAAGGNVDHIKVTHNPREASKLSRIKDAKACYAWPASTLYPWKLAAHVMRENISKGVNLQTHTTVTKVKSSSQPSKRWIVVCERGEIECSQVIHATNAYSSALEPSLRGVIKPIPHICNQSILPVGFDGASALQNSYGVLLADGALITINHRGTVSDANLFGGSGPGQGEFLKWVEEHPETCVDDGLKSFPSVTKAVQKFTESQFSGWKNPSTDPKELYKDSWSGIIGLSADGVPWVGELPGLPGQWICAGHHGHGMARIFTAAPALVKLMNGTPWAETQIPDVFQMTPSRVKGLKQLVKTGRIPSRL